jgi:hypothetical protein
MPCVIADCSVRMVSFSVSDDLIIRLFAVNDRQPLNESGF